MNRLPGQRVRLRYAKDELLQYIGHTDTLRLILRLLHRAEFPYGQSGQFSPKPRIAYGPALPLGITAQNELCEIELRDGEIWDDAQAATMLERLRELEHPAGFVRALELVRPGQLSLAREAVAARYYIEPDGPPELWLAALTGADLGWTRQGGVLVLAAPALIRQGVDGAGLLIDAWAAGAQVFNALACARALSERTGWPWRKLERVSLLNAEGARL